MPNTAIAQICINKENTTNSGTKAADVLNKFLHPENFNANLLNILVHLQLL